MSTQNLFWVLFCLTLKYLIYQNFVKEIVRKTFSRCRMSYQKLNFTFPKILNFLHFDFLCYVLPFYNLFEFERKSVLNAWKFITVFDWKVNCSTIAEFGYFPNKIHSRLIHLCLVLFILYYITLILHYILYYINILSHIYPFPKKQV